MPTSRTEAFSDGVFAVAITLLVFNVSIPSDDHEPLRHALAALWPSYVTYAVSFLTIGIIWVNHHAIFKHVRMVDRPLQFINIFLLMVVAFIPFPTALLGRYIQIGHDGGLAAGVYGLVMTLMSIGFALLWGYLGFHPELLEQSLPGAVVRASLPRFASGTLIYVLGIGVAFISAKLSLAFYAAIAVFYMFNQLRLTGDENESAEPGLPLRIEEERRA